MNTRKDIEQIQLKFFLEGILERYGFDFQNYANASLVRRIQKAMQVEKVDSMLQLLDRMLTDEECMTRFMNILSVDTTEMFRDPRFYIAFRKNIVPKLRERSFLRFWHAGCASGEEVYSTAIVLTEEKLYAKSRLYATDINTALLEEAKAGIFHLKTMQGYTENYIRAGGTKEFSTYYTAKYDNALLHPDLKKNIVWAQHNLVTDASFNEFDVILCRNVMIYFNRTLQNEVHDLLYESLAVGGYLMLGNRESLKFTSHESDYEEIDEQARVYRRVR